MTVFGQPRKHVGECGSTNDLARDWAGDADDAAPSGALVTADFQTRGRGQRGRQWQAGPGQSALMSFVYRLPPGASAGELGLLTALAVAEALASLDSRLDPRLKWPNDVLIDERKVAGMLVEVAGVGAASAAVLGVGVNVNQDVFVGADGFVTPPTSLRLAAGRVWDVQAVIEAVASGLTSWEERWRRDGFAPVLDACRRRLAVGAVLRRGGRLAVLVGLGAQGQAHAQLADGTFAEWVTVDEGRPTPETPAAGVS